MVLPAVTVTWMKLSARTFPCPFGVEDNIALIAPVHVRFTVALLKDTGLAVDVPVAEARTKVDPNNCIGVCPNAVRLEVTNKIITAAEKKTIRSIFINSTLCLQRIELLMARKNTN